LTHQDWLTIANLVCSRTRARPGLQSKGS